MPFRSRSKRRIKVKTPAGRLVIRHESKRKIKIGCSNCGAVLHGVSQLKLAASKRNPSRPFGGVLCSKCSRAAIKERIYA